MLNGGSDGDDDDDDDGLHIVNRGENVYHESCCTLEYAWTVLWRAHTHKQTRTQLSFN